VFEQRGCFLLKVNAKLQRLIIDALSHSMPVHTMVRIVRRVLPNYDINEQTGFPTNIPVPGQDAAKQIMMDLIEGNLSIKFIEHLIDIYENGLMGRKINIRNLQQIVKNLREIGYEYNHEYGIFLEEHGSIKTTGWGVLQEGTSYEFCFLRLDIVGYTKLVRKYSKKIITSMYTDLQEIVENLVRKRNGRIWGWEGDSALIAFHFQDKNIKAVLTGIEILLELFLYNTFKCKIEELLHVRIAIHTGPCQFYRNIKGRYDDTLRHLELLESKYTLTDSMTISPGAYSDLGTKLEKFFKPVKISSGNHVYRYSITWEK
jgi:hypothetical protein